MRVIASEFTKLHSLRSSRLSLLIAFGLVVGLGLFVPWLSVADWRDGTPTAGYNAVERSLSGIYLAQLAFGVLGAMAITGEYATGLIRATFAAVPRRLPVLWSKLGVFLATTFVLGTIASVLAFTAGQAIFSTKHVAASFADPGVPASSSAAVLPGRDGRPRPRARRAAAQHRRGDHDAHARALRRARDRRPAAQGGEDRPVPAVRGGADDHDRCRRGPLSPWGGFGLLCAYVAATIALAAVRWCAETRERLTRHPLLADLLLALVLLALGVVGATAATAGSPPRSRCRCSGAAARRSSLLRDPVVAFGQWLADIHLIADVALLFAVYTVAAQEPRGR